MNNILFLIGDLILYEWNNELITYFSNLWKAAEIIFLDKPNLIYISARLCYIFIIEHWIHVSLYFDNTFSSKFYIAPSFEVTQSDEGLDLYGFII